MLVSSQVNGLHGAVNIVNALKERGVELEFVLDEGLAVLDGIIGGLHGPAALWVKHCSFLRQVNAFPFNCYYEQYTQTDVCLAIWSFFYLVFFSTCDYNRGAVLLLGCCAYYAKSVFCFCVFVCVNAYVCIYLHVCIVCL